MAVKTQLGSHRGPGTVVAALGPTNTGKTHRALERMLQYASGMIGLPLRLLAREVYDRLTTRVGEAAVALVTGEERRVPPEPAYWVCTVEAMPLGRPVEFLAVDEIQLAGHAQRGHIFTDRMLHARGIKETWFLGSPTVGPLLRTFVPEAQLETFERFSMLSNAGHASLRGLPPRSALVAFSAQDVYSLAERLRTLRGGVAVVLGALSPRTRNAQVAMYQAGEVNHLVATDAIGMGLNLSIDHVAFSSLRKFDGRVVRPLQADELGQIAGRAGRHVRDGTFGTLKPLDELPAKTARMIENHSYPALRKLVYRNARLDLSSLAALRQSLVEKPPHPALTRVQQAEDAAVLDHLVASEQVRRLCEDEAGVSLLWETCQVPNFRRQLEAHHAASLLPFFVQVRTRGALDGDSFARTIARLDRTEGDIDSLTDRLERIRTFSYLSHRKGWLPEAAHFQERTRAIEERLGDALHGKLVERFVSRERARPPRRVRPSRDSARPQAEGPFAQLADLHRRAEAELQESEDSFVARIEGAAHGAFAVDGFGRVHFEAEAIGRLTPGTHQGTPGVAPVQADAFSGGAGRRILRRMRALAHDTVAEAAGGHAHLQPMFDSPAGRGLSYILETGLGIAGWREVEGIHRRLSKAERERFANLGLRLGRRLAWLQDAVTQTALSRRWMLAQLLEPSLGALPDPDPLPEFVDAAQALRFGYLLIRRRALRLDAWVRLELHAATVRRPTGDAPAEALDMQTHGSEATQAGRLLLQEMAALGLGGRDDKGAVLKALGLGLDPSGEVTLRRGRRRKPRQRARDL